MDDSSVENSPGEIAMPGLAPAPAPGLDPVELLVDGETFVVSRRADSPRTIDVDWTSHPQAYGFAMSSSAEWSPSRDELVAQIRGFVAEIDPATGFLRD